MKALKGHWLVQHDRIDVVIVVRYPHLELLLVKETERIIPIIGWYDVEVAVEIEAVVCPCSSLAIGEYGEMRVVWISLSINNRTHVHQRPKQK